MVLTSIRQATAALHKAVESRVDFLSPSLTIPRYIRILQAFHAFFAPMEAEMDARCPIELHPLWQDRARAHRLVEDLAAVGAVPSDPAPGSVGLPDISTPPLWLGALYVLEGSTLGGQFISRHLEKHFGWSDGQGYSFFRAHGAETGERWRQVTAAIEQKSAEKSDDAPHIISGAEQTFRRLDTCLCAFL